MKQVTAQTLTLTREEIGEAREVTSSLKEADLKDLRIVVATADGRQIDVPRGMVRFLEAALRAAASGKNVSISSLPEELTSVEAAQLLGISRPTLLKMARAGEIDSHKVGTHTRFRAEDIRQFVKDRTEGQAVAFDDLRSFERGLGLAD